MLIPYLRASGFIYRPRFDFRDPELGHTLRLGVWTVLFVIVTQLAYMFVVRLASGGTADGGDGTGYLIYSSGLLLMMVPHSIVTVSLATAILPRISALAHDGDLRAVGRTVSSTLRTALALVLPFAVLMPLVAGDVANGLFGWGSTDPELFAPTIALFAPALVPFTIHYLMLRGFYALEATRMAFFVQCAVSATNVDRRDRARRVATSGGHRPDAGRGLPRLLPRRLGDQLPGPAAHRSAIWRVPSSSASGSAWRSSSPSPPS